MSQNSTHQTKSSTALGLYMAAVTWDLTEERVTLESVLHTETAGLPHLPCPRQHSAGGASYVGGGGTRKTPFLSHLRTRCWWACPLFECQWSHESLCSRQRSSQTSFCQPLQPISSVPLASLSEYATLLLVCAVGCVLVVLSVTFREDGRTEHR